MIPTTIAAGWVLIGVSLIVLGAVWVLIAVSERAERRATPQQAEVIRRINVVSAGGDANSLDVLLAELLAEVPGQRQPGRWS